MIIDDVVWEIINNGHCAFKKKIETNTFCTEENNVTGLCNRNSCPLGNSRYATVYEEKGVCYLKIKTAERAHTPKYLWETIKLDASYQKALEQIDKELEYWPEFLKTKCKLRFTRLRQILVRSRKIKLEGSAEYRIVSRKAEKREKSRLVKAEKSALIERHISQELLKHLKNGKYDNIYNINHEIFNKVLEKENAISDAEEDYNENDYDKGYINDNSISENEEGEESEEGEHSEQSESKNNKSNKIGDKELSDMFNDKGDKKFVNRKRGKGKHVEIEKEIETEQTAKNDLLKDYI